MSSTVTQVLDNQLIPGTAGDGAFNDGHASEGGIAVDMYEVGEMTSREIVCKRR